MNNHLDISDYLFILWFLYLLFGGFVLDYFLSQVPTDMFVLIWVTSSYALYILAWSVHMYIDNRKQKEQGYVNQRSRK